MDWKPSRLLHLLTPTRKTIFLCKYHSSRQRPHLAVACSAGRSLFSSLSPLNQIHRSILAAYALNPSLDAAPATFSKNICDLMHAGQPGCPLNAYINYAYGNKTTEMIYGYEPWQLERLQHLKKKYDPEGKFNFYNPFVWWMGGGGWEELAKVPPPTKGDVRQSIICRKKQYVLLPDYKSHSFLK